MRRAALLPEKGERGGHPFGGVRQISVAESAPQGVSALLRPTIRGTAGLRTGHGHRKFIIALIARIKASVCWRTSREAFCCAWPQERAPAAPERLAWPSARLRLAFCLGSSES